SRDPHAKFILRRIFSAKGKAFGILRRVGFWVPSGKTLLHIFSPRLIDLTGGGQSRRGRGRPLQGHSARNRHPHQADARNKANNESIRKIETAQIRIARNKANNESIRKIETAQIRIARNPERRWITRARARGGHGHLASMSKRQRSLRRERRARCDAN